VPPPEEVGLSRPDYQNWDLKTTVGYGMHPINLSLASADADERFAADVTPKAPSRVER
jgi:hypothetical protein